MARINQTFHGGRSPPRSVLRRPAVRVGFLGGPPPLRRVPRGSRSSSDGPAALRAVYRWIGPVQETAYEKPAGIFYE